MHIKVFLPLAIIVFLSLALRIYRLPELARISYDESRDLIAERQIITQHKITLIGPEMIIGSEKTFYFGPLHYYLMAPALHVSQYNPIGPSVWTAILGVFTTVVIYLMTRNVYAGLFYAVFPITVIFNRWSWNPNTVPLFIALSLFLLSKRKFILTGIFLGFAIQLHFTALLALALIVPYLISSKEKLKCYIYLFTGVVIGVSPLIMFDLRHDFYNFKNVMAVLQSSSSLGRGLSWHYFLWSFPFLSLVIARLNKSLGIVIVSVCFGISVWWLILQKPDIIRNPQTIAKISSIIASDQKKSVSNFNVATLTDADTRATSYRYFLDLYGLKPLSVLEYSVADHLYVISYDNPVQILYNQTYEVSSFHPKRVSKFWKFGNENIYRLERS